MDRLYAIAQNPDVKYNVVGERDQERFFEILMPEVSL